MAWQNEIFMRDVANAGIVISDRIGRDMAVHLDLKESSEASKYASHPYSTYPRELVCRKIFTHLRGGFVIFSDLKKMSDDGEEEGAMLEFTPTWVVAAVCTIIVAISLAAEHVLYYAG